MTYANTREQEIAFAIAHLREARKLLASARAPHALAKVRRALKSAEGAQRHARGDEYRLPERQTGGRT